MNGPEGRVASRDTINALARATVELGWSLTGVMEDVLTPPPRHGYGRMVPAVTVLSEDHAMDKLKAYLAHGLSGDQLIELDPEFAGSVKLDAVSVSFLVFRNVRLADLAQEAPNRRPEHYPRH